MAEPGSAVVEGGSERHPERIVLVGYGPVGARFVEELLPVVRAGLATLTVVGAEASDAYNRVLIADYAVGRADRESLEITDTAAERAAGVSILTGTSVTAISRTRRTVTLGTGAELAWDRLVLATGARANIPTLDGVTRLRRGLVTPSTDAATLDSAGAALPRGVVVLRDLNDARTVRRAVRAGGRIVVLGAGVLGMELALAAARGGADVCVVYHGEIPMNRNLDRGGGTVLARAARTAGVSMVGHSRAESVLFHVGDDGAPRFDALICADGKQLDGDLLVLSCGTGARTELAHLAGLPVSTGILVDASLTSWADPGIHAIGDCAHVAAKPAAGDSARPPAGGPSGLIGPGWRQADRLAALISAELRIGGTAALSPRISTPVEPQIMAEPRNGDAAPLQIGAEPNRAADPAEAADAAPARHPMPVVMLKAEGVDVVAAGDTAPEPWDSDPVGHNDGCQAAPVSVSQWADPEHGRYVKMVTRRGILTGFVSVGMPRTAAELTLLFERGSELPADRSVLLRFDGPGDIPGADAFAPDATVCWCNGVSVGAIADAAASGNTTVACIGAATRAGTGCGGCTGRIGEVLYRFAVPVAATS